MTTDRHVPKQSSCDTLLGNETKLPASGALRNAGSEPVPSPDAPTVTGSATPPEFDQVSEEATQATELAETERTYPLASGEHRLRYAVAASGQILVHKYSGKQKGGAEIWLPVATPFGVVARLRYRNEQGAYGLRVAVQGMDGRPVVIDFRRSELARPGASEIRAQLFAAGLRVHGDGEGVAVQAFKAADPAREIVVVSRPGWHRLPGLVDPVFVTPNGLVIGAHAELPLELATGVRAKDNYGWSGTMEGWRAAVEAAVTAHDCPHWVLGASAAFAGPLLELAGVNTCGINLSGLSSSGKTFAQRIAVSAWTTPRIGLGLLQSLRTSENAVESLAEASSATLLALDELAHVDGRMLGRIIYTLAGGLGKARLTSEAVLKQRATWATFALLSGECSLEEKVRADGGDWVAGMAVRISDVDVTGINRSVPPAVLQAVSAVDVHYGHAGPAFVTALVRDGHHRNPEPLREGILQTARTIAGEGGDSSRIRAASTFALLRTAGELAQAFGVLPQSADIAGAVRWAWQRFEASSDAIALDPATQVIMSLQAWIAERWDVSIRHVEPELDSFGIKRNNNREAVGWYDADAVYVLTKHIREGAGSALKEQQIARILNERGLLARHEAGRLTVRYVPKVGHAQCYALRRAEFGRLEREPGPELTVYHGGRQ